MPLKLTWRRGATLLWMVMQSCATYEGLPHGPGAGGSAGSQAEGGSAAGSKNGGTSSGNGGAGRGGADGGVSNGGSAVSGSGGIAGSTSPGGNTNSAGEMASGGVQAGGAPDTMAGAGGTPGSAGEAGTAGAGGSSECTSNAPELTCACSAFGAHEYWFCPTYLTFAAAEAKCKTVSMHLPKVETMPEDAWLFDTATKNALGEYFLGATDATTPDEWSWVAGGKLWSGVANGTGYGYTNWSPNEPNGSGDCLVEQANAVWDDRTCTDQRRYICESL